MQVNKGSIKATPAAGKGRVWTAIFWIGLVMAILFYRSFYPGWAHFSNDGPLGAIKADYMKIWPDITGMWQDLYWLGMNAGVLSIDLNTLIQGIAGPVGFAKFLAPISLFWLGICAWVFFRQLKLSPILSIVAALGAALNMNFFSNVCWGLGTRGLTLGWVFLALAALVSISRRAEDRPPYLKWVKVALAGLAVGMGIIEGADNGAIFSLYIGIFIIFLALLEEGPKAKGLAKGLSRAVVVALFAGLISAQTMLMLVGTQVKGMAGMQQEEQSKEERWNWATQWSLPKAETLRLLIPGVYGYRLDSPNGKAYWGRVGETPGYEQTHQGISRFSGSGEYAGVLVLLIAIWALAESWRKGNSAFDPKERKIIWFWAVAAIISLLLAWGRFAPFYRLFYSLPYFSTIRNPIKFMHPFHLSVMILFGYGLLGLSRRYLESAMAKAGRVMEQLKGWWAKAPVFEKRWTYASLAVIGVSMVGYLSYFSNKPALEKKISAGFGPDLGAMMAAYSVREVGVFILVLCLAVGLVTLIFSGFFAGKRAQWAGLLLGLLLVGDMARANKPWIKFYNYEEKYASNPIVEILRGKPYEQRVVIPPVQGGRDYMYLQQLYMVEWLQHHFPFYNIQSLDVSQEPRMPADKLAYRMALSNSIGRYWQLTSTRYVIGTADMAPLLNSLDPEKNRFRVHTKFKAILKSGSDQLTTIEDVTVTTNAQEKGLFPTEYALIEFTGALPKAKLYSRWQTTTNDQEILQQLASPGFDPDQVVLISGTSPASSSTTNANPGKVEFVSYAPKQMQLRSEADGPTVLLLNDKYDAAWKVRVDGQPAPLLRANYIVRGVSLPAGKHTIEFRFEPEVKYLALTLAAIGLGVLLCGVLVVSNLRAGEPKASPAPAMPAPQSK